MHVLVWILQEEDANIKLSVQEIYLRKEIKNELGGSRKATNV